MIRDRMPWLEAETLIDPEWDDWFFDAETFVRRSQAGPGSAGIMSNDPVNLHPQELVRKKFHLAQKKFDSRYDTRETWWRRQQIQAIQYENEFIPVYNEASLGREKDGWVIRLWAPESSYARDYTSAPYGRFKDALVWLRGYWDAKRKQFDVQFPWYAFECRECGYDSETAQFISRRNAGVFCPMCASRGVQVQLSFRLATEEEVADLGG